MSKRYEKCRIISNELVAQDTCLMKFVCSTKNITPGQFVHVKAADRQDLLLRRPISINSVNMKKSTISLIIQVKGEGTKAICNLKKGDYIDVISSAGRGFLLNKSIKKAAVAGGGIGIAPLKYAIQYYSNIVFDSYIGFRSAQYAYQIDDFKAISNNTYICTDDGSLGEKGFITKKLDINLEITNYDVILACGPKPMLIELKKVINKYNANCLVSLEERMGCGIGACKVCVCKTNENDEEDFKRICLDGPVFDINKVVL